MVEKIKRSLLQFLHKSIYKPGHYYSPIPDRKEIMAMSQQLFDVTKRDFFGIDLREKQQIELLEQLKSYPSLIEQIELGASFYDPDNSEFILPDAWLLYAMLQHLKPKRVIEVGSGFSSMVLLTYAKTNQVKLTFIEPNPGRFHQQLGNHSVPIYTIHQEKVQDVSIDLFFDLEPSDLLFIDSSHVGKIGSDLLHLLFEVVPRLREGVFIHFHDITYPFEYPKEWIEEGRYWNEAYFLRAFLMNNSFYRITFFNHFMHLFHADQLPPEAKDQRYFGGGSFYLEKIAPK